MDIKEVRKKFPQYNDLSDTQLADALHAKFYSDIPKDDFYSRIGLTQPKPPVAPVASAPVTAPVTAPVAAFVDAPVFGTEPMTGLVEGADYSSTDPFMSAITPPEPKIRPKSVLEGVKAPPPLPTEDPMIRPEFVTAMERRIGALPAQERAAALANLTKRPDVYGRAARVVQGRMGVLEAQQPKPSLISQMFDTPEEQARKQALAQPEVSPLVSGIADPRLEAQVAKLVTEGGMEAGAAEAYARQELEQGRIPRVLPMMRAPTPGEVALERQAQQYEVDQTASGIETAIRAVQRIGKAGELALGKAGGGMQLFLGEMSGADVSGVKDKLGYIAAFNQAMGENPYKPLQIIESAGTSIVQQLPALVAGAITGSQPLVLASMYANSFGDTYADGRERGLDKADSTARAAIFGAFEVLGEKFGLGASLDLIKGAAKGKPLSELAGYFAKQITKEIPGEQLTYAGQFATDKGFGLNPEAGIEEFLRGAAETAIVTATQAGMMLGGAAATSKALRAVGGVRYTPEAPPSVAPPTAPPIPPAPPAQKEPARPAERIEPTIDMGELERVAAGMPERAEPPLEGGRAPIQKMFDELKQVSGLTAEAPPAEAPPAEPAPAEPPAPPRVEAPPAEPLSIEEQIRALEEQQKSLLTKAGKVPAVKSPARKKYDALGEQINALRGQVETPAAPEAPAPTPPVAEAPKVEPPKEAPATPKPETPKETPAAPKPAGPSPMGFRKPTKQENSVDGAVFTYDVGNGARLMFEIYSGDIFIAPPGKGSDQGFVIRAFDGRSGTIERLDQFPDFIPRFLQKPLLDYHMAVRQTQSVEQKKKLAQQIIEAIERIQPPAVDKQTLPKTEQGTAKPEAPTEAPAAPTTPKAPTAEAAPPVAPAKPRGVVAPPQKEQPPQLTPPPGFKVKKGRNEQVVLAARELAAGRISKQEYDRYVDFYTPIETVLGGKIEQPISDDLMTDILTKKIPQKKDPKLVNAPIADGARVGLRMDIPALEWGRENGVNGSVVSIHQGADPSKARGKNVSYKSTGHLKNVVFAPRSEEASFGIAQMLEGREGQKKPQHTMEGEWVNTPADETFRLVKSFLDDPNWVQVSLDPLRHSFFYARDTKRPVISADEALQVGRFVLVKNPVYGDRQQFLYSIEPEVSRRTPLGFYSALANGIEGIKTNAAPVSGWKEAIKGLVNKGAVKADEVEWSGVNDWLDLQQGRVTKEDLLNYLRQNGVQVEETVLGGRPSMLGGDMERLLELQDERELTPEEEKQLRELRATPKFGSSNLVLPGGENYREVLLTLPEDSSAVQRKLKELDAEATRLERAGDPRWLDVSRERGELLRSQSSSTYRSRHWDQPNVIAHIRVNDRTDADGNKVLFVEEIQSDWGQEGKKKGFGQEESVESYVRNADNTGWVVTKETKPGIPAAPFVTKTEGWLNLALKRIAMMAVEGGYDKVAFVNGEQSADRYDLSKQIDGVGYTKNSDGTIDIAVYRKGSTVLDRTMQTPAQVEDLIGKELTRKIVDSPEQVDAIEGLDLKVGGEGMKTFYNQIVPLAIKKLLPKVGGGQMEMMKIGRSEPIAIVKKKIEDNAIQYMADQISADEFLFNAGLERVLDEEQLNDALGSTFPSKYSDRRRLAQSFSETFAEKAERKKELTQPGFDVTPAMREKVETTGLPLFSLNPSIIIAVTGNLSQRSQSYKREAKKLTRAYEKGKITSDEFARRMGILKTEDEQLKKESVELVRGADHLVSRLRAAVRNGELSQEAVQLAQWFIDNNPQLVDDLAISLTSPKQGGVGGMYESFTRLMTLIKFKGDKNTVVHEILHHLERMMPPDIQAAIRKEWTKQLLDAKKKAKTPQEKLYYETLMAHHFGEGRMSFDNVPEELRELYTKLLAIMGVEGERVNAMTLANHLLKTGGVDRNLYQYYSPSEFWAVNGSDIVRGRYDAIKGGLLTRLKNWLRELGEKIKSIFGLKSEAALIRALDSLAKADGKFVTKQILDQTQVAYGIEPEKKQTDTPEFKRWFGDSKVVDENGEPLVVYHSTRNDFSVFDTDKSELGSHFGTVEQANHFGAQKGRRVMPVYLSIKNPLRLIDQGQFDVPTAVAQLIDDGIMSPRTADKLFGGDYTRATNSDIGTLQKFLFDEGYDGIVYLNRREGIRPNTFGPNGDENYSVDEWQRITDEMPDHEFSQFAPEARDSYIAFYPEQIKSAIGNIGTFDPTDPNILYSIEPDRKAAPKKMIEPATIDRLRESWTVGRDELGRPNFGPGAKAYDTVARITNVVLDKILMKPISPELGRAMRNMKVEIDKAQKKVATLGKELSKLSSQERELISDVIEGELKADVIPPQHIIDIAASMVEIMSAQGQEMVRLGMLSKEAFMRWENKYLPRFYLNNLGKEAKAWATATKRLLMKQPTMQGIKGQQLKSRGMYQQIYTEDLPDWIAQGWEQRDADFDPKTSVETVVWRDYTREEREEMGEIRDAMFRFVMGYNASQRDIALGRLYESLSENYASKSRIEGYVKVRETMVEGTNVNRYGKLAGMYVPKEIMDHLVWNDKAMSNGLYKLYQAGLGRWKEGKTVLNPTAHANNVFSNFTMAHFAGVSYWDVEKYAGALKDFVTNDEMLKEAEDIGLFTGTFSQTEMVENMPAELKQLANMTGSQLAKYGDKAWDLLSLTLEWDGKKYGVRPMMKWMYENEDFFFRYLIYRDARNRGMEPEDAREYSNQFIFTYDDLPAGARVFRDIGMPFFSYTYKVVPVLARTALEYPWRFAAPAAAVYTLNALMYSIAASVGGDEDDWWGKTLYKYVTDKDFRQKANQLEEEERKNLPSWMKGKSSLGTEKAIRLGMDDITGLPLFLDISRIFPGGDLLDAENNAGGLALLQPLTPSNPVLTSLVAMLANKDMFLGKDVVLATDTDAEKARKRAAWLWKQWAPSISVGNYHFDRGMNTIANMTGKPITVDAGPMGVIDYTGVGKDGLPVIPKYAVLQTFGVKVRPYDLEVSAAIEKSKQDRLIKELAIEIKRINRLEEKGSISPAAAELLRSQAQNKQELLKDGLTVEGKPKK